MLMYFVLYIYVTISSWLKTVNLGYNWIAQSYLNV